MQNKIIGITEKQETWKMVGIVDQQKQKESNSNTAVRRHDAQK